MLYPKLNEQATSRQMVDTFRGYNHNLRISDGEFFDMKNMTSDYYFLLLRGPTYLAEPYVVSIKAFSSGINSGANSVESVLI